MKYLKWLILILLINFCYSNVFSWSYPLKDIAKSSCKYDHRSSLDSNCKEKLPIIHNANYENYKNDMNYRRVYTILWMSSYKWWWDVGKGTHLWSDIATAQWTPVYSIGAGKVVWWWWMNGWGKTVVIQHKLDNGKYIYSNYTHLEKVIVNAQTQIKEWQQIWTVGHTWNSIWNHLHFQIDTNQAISKHPWYHSSSCSAWMSIFDIVNGTSCQEEALASTLDPIAFLESNGANIPQSFDKIIVENSKTIVEKQISREEIVSIEQIREEEVKNFIKKYDININVYPIWWSVEVGNYGKIILSITKKSNWKPFKGLLPDDIIVNYNTKYISSLYPRWIKIIEWNREISFLTKKTWVTPINMSFGTVPLFNNIYIRIINKWESIVPDNAYIQLLWSRQYINEDRFAIVVMRDKNMNKIINVNYQWKYKIYSDSNNIKFCKIKISTPDDRIKLSRHFCKNEDIKNSLEFSYNDTIKGVYIYKVVWNIEWFYNISVSKDGKNIWNSRFYRIKNIKDISKSIYSKFLWKAEKYWIMLGLVKKWYFTPTRELSLYDAKTLIKNFIYSVEHNIWKAFPSNIKLSKEDKYKKITRWKLVELIFENLWYKVKNYETIDYIDLKWQNESSGEKKDLANIAQFLKLRWFQWQDRYGEKYFQAKKNIKRDEAIYLIYSLEKMLIK